MKIYLRRKSDDSIVLAIEATLATLVRLRRGILLNVDLEKHYLDESEFDNILFVDFRKK